MALFIIYYFFKYDCAYTYHFLEFRKTNSDLKYCNFIIFYNRCIKEEPIDKDMTVYGLTSQTDVSETNIQNKLSLIKYFFKDYLVSNNIILNCYFVLLQIYKRRTCI